MFLNSLKLNFQLNDHIFSLFFFFPLQLHGTKIKGWKIETWIFNLCVTLADFSKCSFLAAWLQGRTAAKSFMKASLPRKAHNLYTNNVNGGSYTFAEELSLKWALFWKREEDRRKVWVKERPERPPLLEVAHPDNLSILQASCCERNINLSLSISKKIDWEGKWVFNSIACFHIKTRKRIILYISLPFSTEPII